MKKFFKSLFGRPFVVVIALIIQAVFLVAVALFLQSASVVLLAVAQIVALFAIVHLVNRDMPPEGKTTWAVILLVVPICGLIVYSLFSHNHISKVQQRRLRKISAQTQSFVDSDKKFDQQTKTQLGEYFGQAHFLTCAGCAQLYTDSQTQYFKDGKSFWHDLLAELEKAQKFIFLEFFIIQRGQMWNAVLKILKQKVEQGVEVRVMYDDLGTVAKLPFNYHRHLRSLGINCIKFNRILPVISAVHNNRDHRKIVVIDGNVGFVGGSNLADEYISKTKKYGVWKDCAVRLDGNAVKSLTIMFLQLFDIQTKRTKKSWESYLPTPCENFPTDTKPTRTENLQASNTSSTESLKLQVLPQTSQSQDENVPTEDKQLLDNSTQVSQSQVENVPTEEKQLLDNSTQAGNTQQRQKQTADGKKFHGFVIPFGDGPKPLYGQLIAEQAYLNIINTARKKLVITTPYLILDQRLKSALQCASQRGVDVCIITPNIPDKKFVFTVTRFNYLPLQQAGVKIFQFTDGFMHGKSILADDSVAIVGTINLDYRSLLHHYECGVWMCGTEAIDKLKADLDDILKDSTLQTENVLNPLQRLVAKIAMIFAPLL